LTTQKIELRQGLLGETFKNYKEENIFQHKIGKVRKSKDKMEFRIIHGEGEGKVTF
jgi:hypothetical protein